MTNSDDSLEALTPRQIRILRLLEYIHSAEDVYPLCLAVGKNWLSIKKVTVSEFKEIANYMPSIQVGGVDILMHKFYGMRMLPLADHMDPDTLVIGALCDRGAQRIV